MKRFTALALAAVLAFDMLALDGFAQTEADTRPAAETAVEYHTESAGTDKNRPLAVPECREDTLPPAESPAATPAPETTEKPAENPPAGEQAPREEIPAPVGNWVFWAASREEAEKTALDRGGVLVSFENGIGEIYINEEKATEGPAPFSVEKSAVTLYPNYLYTVEAEEETPEETVQSLQWHIGALEMEKAWEISTGRGVRVAVIDTGIDTDHPALKDNIVAAETIIPEDAYGYGGFFLTYKGAEDALGHGTHVAGIIGAKTEDKSVMGIAPDCEIHSIKALEKSGNYGTGYTSWIANAVLKAAQDGADVINMSVGGSRREDRFIAQAIEIAVESGCTVVCAAGNWNGLGIQNAIDYPAFDENTIAVTAAKQTQQAMEIDLNYSKYGEKVDFCAPGTSIYSTVPEDYGTKKGTSMACPVVAGTVALVAAVLEDGTAQEIKAVMEETALDLGTKGWDEYYGHGLIQPFAAVEEAFKEATATPTPRPTPKPTKKPAKKPKVTPRPRPAVTPAPTPRPQPPVTPPPVITPAPDVEEKAERLKDRLATIPPEMEQEYTTQTGENTGEAGTEKATALPLWIAAPVLLIFLILLFRRKREEEESRQ